MKTAQVLETSGFKFRNVEFPERARLRETNDCVVRAIASSFDVSYMKAHRWAESYFDRKYRKGVYMTSTKMEKCHQKFGSKIKRIGVECRDNWGIVPGIKKRDYNGEIFYTATTVNRFIKEHPVGRYFLIVKGHAFAVIDGIVEGNYSDATQKRKKLRAVFKITPIVKVGEVKFVEDKPSVVWEGEKLEVVFGETKKCKSCGKVHKKENMQPNVMSKDKMATRCKPCHKAWKESKVK